VCPEKGVRVLRSHVVRLSVTLVDCDHMGWNSSSDQKNSTAYCSSTITSTLHQLLV